MLILITVQVKMYGVGVSATDLMFIPGFVKI